MWLCVCVRVGSESCILWGGRQGHSTVNRSSWASAHPPDLSLCSLPFYHFLFDTHRNTLRQVHKHSHSYIHTTYSLSVDQRFQSLSPRTLSHSLSLPLSLTGGPPACFTVSRKRVKQVLSFPPLRCKLPGGENRLRCHPIPNLSPRWTCGKQTVELPDRSRET